MFLSSKLYVGCISWWKSCRVYFSYTVFGLQNIPNILRIVISAGNGLTRLNEFFRSLSGLSGHVKAFGLTNKSLSRIADRPQHADTGQSIIEFILSFEESLEITDDRNRIKRKIKCALDRLACHGNSLGIVMRHIKQRFDALSFPGRGISLRQTGTQITGEVTVRFPFIRIISLAHHGIMRRTRSAGAIGITGRFQISVPLPVKRIPSITHATSLLVPLITGQGCLAPRLIFRVPQIIIRHLILSGLTGQRQTHRTGCIGDRHRRDCRGEQGGERRIGGCFPRQSRF